MSTLRHPPEVKLFISFIFNQEVNPDEITERLALEFGPVDFLSCSLDFRQTRYYEEEMGPGLTRKIVGFERLIDRTEIVDVKILTNSIEEEYSDISGKRNVNADPGYIAGEHIILATGKGYAHRPYLGKGVYADLTLVYQKNNFKPLEWTYPDYRQKDMLEIFHRMRKNYMNRLKEDR